MKKIKYEKPTSLDAGQVAAIQGASCSNVGSSATDICRDGNNAIPGGCGWGVDPTSQPYCDTGSVATGNCYPQGGTAGASCHDGAKPGW
jgi:hypothetical protein